ncbi:MAG: hypothetical protein HGA44_12015, partial [Cellulomonadaceae bacterium]|nr:hypothetical protein [Cellulomonadaceae bacterium]
MIDAALARVPRRLRQTGLAVLVAGLAVTGVLASGLDAQRTETVESAVWVMRAAGQYARVDTDLGEIDTVRLVADPSTVVQSGGEALLLTSGLHTRWAVDPADPADLEQAGEGSSPSPTGTVDVASAGSWVAYLTDSGRTWVQQVSDGAVAPATALDPAPELDQASSGATDQASDDEPADPYAADLVAVDDAGAVAVYSQAERAVRVLDAATGEVTAGPTALEQAPDDADPLSIALVGSRWAVLDQTGGRLWVQDLDAPVQLGTTDAVLQQSATVEGPVRLADRSGLLEVDATGELTRPVEASGTPAVPVVLEDGTVVAAWLAETGGTLWTGRTDASGDTVPLTDDDGILAQLRDLTPVIRSNGARAVLEETGSGLLWTVPDGLAV